MFGSSEFVSNVVVQTGYGFMSSRSIGFVSIYLFEDTVYVCTGLFI